MVGYCCVNGCKNNSNNFEDHSNTKTLFHVFPSNPELKAKWLKAIGRPDWNPPDNARICSDHFNSCQINTFKNFESSLVEVCRVCLATDEDATLYTLQNGHLKEYLDTILAINDDSHIEGLPQFVCYECGICLRKCYNMIKKINMSQTILHRIFAENGEITEPLVKKINRESLKLKSALEPHNITPTYLFNYEFNYQENLSYLTSIDYLYDVNETKIEWDKSSDTNSIQTEHNNDDGDNENLEKDELDKSADTNSTHTEHNDDDGVNENLEEDELDKNSDTISIHSEHKDDDDVIEKLEEDVISVSDNVLYVENDINVDEEYCIFYVGDDINGTGLSEKNPDENSENILRSIEKLAQTSNNKSNIKTKRPRKRPDQTIKRKNESRDHFFERFFTVVTFDTLQEKIDEWYKSMENPSWLSKDKTNNLYKCEICKKIFANLQTYKEHSILHDPISGKTECPVCKIRQKSERAVAGHMSALHSKKFYCNLCPDKIFSNKMAADKHLAAHMGRVYRCGQCSFTSRHSSALSKHKQDDHSHGHACELCGRACVNLKGLQQHRLRRHPGQTVSETDNKYPCEKCNFSFANEEALRVHLLTSPQHKKLKEDPSLQNTCRHCGQQFTSYARLRGHHRSIHSHMIRNRYVDPTPDKYPTVCEHCDEEIQTRLEHYFHMRREHPNKQYQSVVMVMCEICGKGFQNQAKLRYHMLRHNSPKVPCPVCKKLFHDHIRLKLHEEAVHSAVKRYPCRTCGAIFTNQANLIRHDKIHTDLTPYECSLCGKQVKHKANLKRHIRTVHWKMPYPSEVNRKKRKRNRNRDAISDNDPK